MTAFHHKPLREQLTALRHCHPLPKSAFEDGVNALKGKQIVILGCGAQGLNQGLNLRDSGLNVAYALRQSSIDGQNASYRRASDNGFFVASFEELVPKADLVINLTPDKQHGPVVNAIMPLMKEGAALGYSHGFDVIEAQRAIRSDITVIMVAPKCPGTEVRAEYVRGFGVPTLIAVHQDPEGKGQAWAKAWCAGTGGHRAGVLESSFEAEVKSDLMGEQTVLCGLPQAVCVAGFERLAELKVPADQAAAFFQYGIEQVAESMKAGGVRLAFSRLSPGARAHARAQADAVKAALRPLFEKHMDDILAGRFAERMMTDWQNDDVELLTWRQQSSESAFEQAPPSTPFNLDFDRASGLVALFAAGVELAFEVMVAAGISPASAYYESLHELPLIANTLARRRLHEMNLVISDTAEYGNYLFADQATGILKTVMAGWDLRELGEGGSFAAVDDAKLAAVDEQNQQHPIEAIGASLRAYMRGH
ncbi:ketol-acid reductoisomerase [Gallaecimonas kandeliae]|uniref:ketol-acid reductoisomerase n=1 Tax=Gallaecimonas kandeliae TaxID=3029055 RepID=UPI002648D2DA|nr:ketol-acid reductoisomerase [Gallaecimonas kandeliae]WKE67236.1 ketol-acid reductoisomerase [Gallaecimonas kandeliae]